MAKQFFFLCGLPRSGSTVLASLLAQNPDVYTSPNSSLVELLVNVNKHLSTSEQSRAFLQPTQRTDVLRHCMAGMYDFTDRPVVIDKSRAWPHPHNLALLDEVLGEPVKMIATVRDLPSVLASFVRKIHEHPEQISFVDKALRQAGTVCSDQARAHTLFAPGGTVYEAWYTLKQAFDEGWGERIHLIEYDELVAAPDVTLARLYDFLELPTYHHDYANITNPTPENDDVYTMPGLHTIAPTLTKTAPDPQVVLGEELYQKYSAVPHFWHGGGAAPAVPKPTNPLHLTATTTLTIL